MCTNCKQLCTFITHRMAPPSETLQKQLWTDFPPFQYFHHILNCSYLRERAAGGCWGSVGGGVLLYYLQFYFINKILPSDACVWLLLASVTSLHVCVFQLPTGLS